MRVSLVLPLLVGALLAAVAAAAATPPPGGVIAFERDTGTAATVVLYDPAAGTARDLVSGGQPAWSPDGTRIAYVQGEAVYVAKADGSSPVAVGSGEWPAWSPDGTRLAVSRFDGVATPSSAQGTRQLNVIDLATLAEMPLTSGSTDAVQPAWSPDGTEIAYAAPSAVAVVPVQGGPGRTIGAPRPPSGGPAWSPDGRRLAFIASNGQVWVVGAEGSNAHQVTYTLLAPPPGVPQRPAWSPDGTSIVWAQGADLCLTSLDGAVRRLTYTAAAPQPVLAALPAWQPGATVTPRPVDPLPGALKSCDWNPGARIELLPGGVSPSDVALVARQTVVFVNHASFPLTVTTTFQGSQGTVQPGDVLGVTPAAGQYTFTVSGYPDVPRRGTLDVRTAGSVTIEPHAAVRYGRQTLLSGTASGPAAGTVAVVARPLDTQHPIRVASVTPVRGRWSVNVAPKVGTSYTATFDGAQAVRVVKVLPDLRVQRGAGTVTATLRPLPRLAGRPVLLFHFTPAAAELWTSVRSARTDAHGVAVFRRVPAGRYYVAAVGDALYMDTASEPFNVHG